MKSVLAMSMPKAGSTIADRILVDFCNEKGYEIDRIAARVSKSPLPEAQVFLEYQGNIRLEGVYYGMAREAVVGEMHVVSGLKAIVQMRDPRDCITSAYFSFGQSHQLPTDPEKARLFMERRQRIQDMGIDGYAISRTRDYLKRMRVLAEIIDRHDDILLLKYEEMVSDTETWLQRIAEFLEQPLNTGLRKALRDKTNFTLNNENISRHKRQIAPGDHKRKLQPATIAEMNGVLAPQLARFGYAP